MRRTGRFRHLFLAILAAAGLTVPAGAYPITPVTLWDLLTASRTVVLADVESVTDCSGEKEEGRPPVCRHETQQSIAELRVRETWKGPETATLLVRFQATLICPAPPRYEPGRMVIAFLNPYASVWETTALSYGTLYPAAGEVEPYRTLVAEALRLQARPPVPREAQLDWLILAASRRATRWQGIYELLPAADSLHSWYDGDLERRMGSESLTPDQYLRLARGFAEEPSIDRTLPMLLALFEGRPSHAVDRGGMAAVERLMLEPAAPWWIGEALGPLLRRLGDPAPVKRLQPLGDPFGDKEIETVRRIWKQAKIDLDLPDVPPAIRIPREVDSVGSDTPS